MRGLSMPHECQGKKVNVDTLRIESLKNRPEFIGVHVSSKGILVPRPPNPIGAFRRVPCVIGLCFYRVLTLLTLATVLCDLCRRYTAPMTQEAIELLKKALPPPPLGTRLLQLHLPRVESDACPRLTQTTKHLAKFHQFLIGHQA